MTRICSVIPAAGRGSRLGLDCPKILVPIDDNLTVWDVLRNSLAPVSERIHVVLAPSAMAQFSGLQTTGNGQFSVTTSAQAVPLGMGDAIFGAEPFWHDFETILIVWGDQVNLSAETLKQVAARTSVDKTMVLPLVECQTPYVQYDLTDGVLTHVRQSREGDAMDPVGFSDVGVFALSVPGLLDCWHQFVKKSVVGAQTNELNFLPFLPFLSHHCRWNLHTVIVSDPVEALGINTPEDLQITRERFARLKHHR
jgi:bifunctional UDP-N-acetylglucosamine pyrophosphorylase / glucosamine-1-phosphate N-acetyltransferase